MSFRQKKQNLLLASKDPFAITIAIVGTLLILALQYFFSDLATLKGNLGATFATVELVSGILLALLFGINAGLLYYKLRLASSVNAKESGSTILGGIFGIIVTGCPACSITLASYLGLASILSTLPFYGMEIKIIGLLLLLYSTNTLLKNLTVCKQKQPTPAVA